MDAQIEGLKQTLADLNDDEIDSLIEEKESLKDRLMAILVNLSNVSVIDKIKTDIADADKIIKSGIEFR